MFKYWLHSIACLGIVFAGCSKNTDGRPFYEAPPYFPEKVYNMPYNKAKFELGRKLFNDKLLSADNTVSCASCHQQFAAFAHSGHAVSHGINNKLGIRNAPGIFNLAWQKRFMWDGGINHLEVMPIAPITNPVEMNLPLAGAVAKLNSSAEYKKLFNVAFGGDEITSQQMLVALANYMAAMVSANSKYDRYLQGEETLTADEQKGLDLFNNHCTSCHAGVLFTDQSYRNNGLDSVYSKDTGRHHVTQDVADMGKFKVPTLRNVALTGPYMHDGRFASLEAVLNHYTMGIKHSATLDETLQNGIALSTDEKVQLIAFLNTLTDTEFAKNPVFK